MEHNLRDIILKCQKNERKAQADLYREFSGVLYSICLRYADNYDDAQDTFQEGFIKLFEKIHQYQFSGAFEGWAKRLMVNFCLERLRDKTKFLHEELNEETFLDVEDEVDFTDLHQLTYNQIILEVQQLPPRYREVFNLYVFEEIPHQEISKMLNISVGASKSNLSRAREQLKKALEQFKAKAE